MTRVKYSGMITFSLVSNPQSSYLVPSVLPLRYEVFSAMVSDIGYSKKFYSDIRYYVGLWTDRDMDVDVDIVADFSS